MNNYLSGIPEIKLRQLAVDLARDIKTADEVLRSLGLTDEQYDEIKNTRAFKSMYEAAYAEWNAAGNTQKRAKLKAAAMTEEILPMFYLDIEERKESLTARVSLLQTIAKIGGLGQPEPVTNVGNGQFFKLEIHLQGHDAPIIIDGDVKEPQLAQSRLAVAEDYDEL